MNKTPVRLAKVENRTAINVKELLMQFGFTIALIISLILFVVTCFLMTQPTYGLFWY